MTRHTGTCLCYVKRRLNGLYVHAQGRDGPRNRSRWLVRLFLWHFWMWTRVLTRMHLHACMYMYVWDCMRARCCNVDICHQRTRSMALLQTDRTTGGIVCLCPWSGTGRHCGQPRPPESVRYSYSIVDSTYQGKYYLVRSTAGYLKFMNKGCYVLRFSASSLKMAN